MARTYLRIFRKLNPFNWIMAALVGLVAIADVVVMKLADVDGITRQFAILAIVLPIFLPYIYTRWRRLKRVSDAIECIQWSLVIEAALLPLIFCAGRSSAPLADRTLAHMDALAGFSEGGLFHFAQSLPAVAWVLNLAYQTAVPLAICAVVIPSLAGQREYTERFILATSLATIMTAAIFFFVPAVGPWVVFGFSPAMDQTSVEPSLRLLKASGPAHLATGIKAIVTFPSFHVIIAVLSGIGLWGFRRLRPAIFVLTAAICISTLTTGWHYATDVVGGLGVVVASQYVAAWMLGVCAHGSTAVITEPASPGKATTGAPAAGQ